MGGVIGVLPVAVYNVYTTNKLMKTYYESRTKQIENLQKRMDARIEAYKIKYPKSV